MKNTFFASILNALICVGFISCANQKITDAINAYEMEAQQDSIAISSIVILQHGKLQGEKYFAQEKDDAHVMWSVSKTFTSFAVGFAIQEGLLKLDTRISDIFPDETAAVLDTLRHGRENLLQATVRDYLTMSCGQAMGRDAVIDMAVKYGLSDIEEFYDFMKDGKHSFVQDFLTMPFDSVPGTYRSYNSASTYILSAAVQKLSGEKINDYLESRLWQPLDIEKPRWDEAGGINCGGWGLYLKTSDMAKVGQMMLERGRYNGMQIVPADYLTEAVKPYFQWEASEELDPEVAHSRTLGYGYLIWWLEQGFEANGRLGQYIIVLPEKDAVIAATADQADMTKEHDLIFKHLVPVL